ncbi:DUF309 domain-containing protein [Streptomyces sp. BBFR102]|uniref:DUF309 domain-containing protein n=1 Tax=Streptomyces sp. BBFR102 TaxID=3448171 RepID=UPI003F53AFA9
MESRNGRSAGAGEEHAAVRPDRGRDRDAEGRARNARPRDGLGRPLSYDAPGVPRAPEGVVRTAGASVDEAQELLRAGRPFHAHEVFEDAWKSGPTGQRALWRGLAQTAVGLTHAARGNTTGGARLLRRGADEVERWAASGGAVGASPGGLDAGGVVAWARALADRVDAEGPVADAAAVAPQLRAPC